VGIKKAAGGKVINFRKIDECCVRYYKVIGVFLYSQYTVNTQSHKVVHTTSCSTTVLLALAPHCTSVTVTPQVYSHYYKKDS